LKKKNRIIYNNGYFLEREKRMTTNDNFCIQGVYRKTTSPSNPSGIGSIDLSRQKLTQLPDWIFECTNLEELNIENNPLQEGQVRPIFEKLKQLKRLIANDCKLKSDELSSITEDNQLTTLDLSKNQIQEIPDVLVKVKTLQYLYLGSNKIRQLPPSFTRSKFKCLDVSNNPFEKSKNKKSPLKST
jgi:Leucine-rich repeat (LRR) protein